MVKNNKTKSLLLMTASSTILAASYLNQQKNHLKCDEFVKLEPLVVEFERNGNNWHLIDENKPVYTKLASVGEMIRYYLFKFLSVVGIGVSGFSIYKIITLSSNFDGRFLNYKNYLFFKKKII